MSKKPRMKKSQKRQLFLDVRSLLEVGFHPGEIQKLLKIRRDLFATLLLDLFEQDEFPIERQAKIVSSKQTIESCIKGECALYYRLFDADGIIKLVPVSEKICQMVRPA